MPLIAAARRGREVTTVADLYPTKTRLDLLREVLADNVIDGDISLNPLHHGHHVLVDPTVGRPHRRVCARIRELESAGWVELPDGTGIWQMTAAGYAVLDGAR